MSRSTIGPITVVGVARDVASTVCRVVQHLSIAIEPFGEPRFFVVESDSIDGTKDRLHELAKSRSDFKFCSLGNLQQEHPIRTVRLATARNHYVEYLRSSEVLKRCDYVVVADFDKINLRLNRKSFGSCFIKSDWDGVFANQSRNYYDVWALRAKQWCETDCFQELAQLVGAGVDEELAWRQAVVAKQVCVDPRQDWIRVQSAFGGIAIYRSHLFLERSYRGTDVNGQPTCEHVSFHIDEKLPTPKFFINPRFVNAKWTPHTRHFQISHRILHRVMKLAR